MQKIITHLWYDKQAKEAAEFYTTTFKDAKIENSSTLEGTPSGSVDTVVMSIAGQRFMMISAGPYFTFNPSISLLVACETEEEVEALWSKLSPGGKVLMELAEYPFSKKYGWTEDKYGLSWQIMLNDQQKPTQKITPALMFVGDNYGKAEDAIAFYQTVFKNTKLDHVMRYTVGEEPDKEGAIKHAGFTLEGIAFAVMESAWPHDFAFNEAISFMVYCKDQAEIDYYWEKLSAVPEAEQCGWLKDKYGVSWQIVPVQMDTMMQTKDKDALARVTKAFLAMKKFDLAELQKAYESK